MRGRTLAILGGITALVLVLAIIFAIRSRQDMVSDLSGSPVFPDLSARLNDVATIRLTGKDGTGLTLSRGQGETWTIAERGGYAARFERIKPFLVGLADAKLIEPRTRKPENFAALGLVEPGQDGATGSLIALQDGAGEPIASLVVGKEPTTTAGALTNTIYVRKPGDDQTWLARGLAEPELSPARWMNTELFVVVRERLMAATTRRPDGKAVRVFRLGPKDDMFQLEGLPAGKELKDPGAANGLGTLIQLLNFEDVRKAEGIDFAKDPLVNTFLTFDGAVVTATTVEVDGRSWTRFDVTFDQAQSDTAKGLPSVPAPDGTSLILPADKVKAQVDAWNAAVTGWAFELPGYKLTVMRNTVDDLVQPIPPASGTATPPAQ
ncbi:DUF4340 domain-containing protein [Zavarzinia sp. CC-PAN008]|uniref:DUF4340 domain-containing protein n=1 Tax=Zavarzinia sp. CC-PAN008 TaxID=3243332 RepID=UPI003F748606